MTRLFIAMLAVSLATGCTSTSSLFSSNEPPPPPLPSGGASQMPDEPQATPRGPMTPAATAAAEQAGGAPPGELLDCVSNSCRINCSQKVKPQFRPKWCANFKSPD